MWDPKANEGNETQKIHDRIAGFVFGHGADLGCGCWKLKIEKTREASCLGIDGGFSPFACKEADLIADVANLTQFQDESFDYIFSSHTLEDMPYPEAVLMEWWRLVKVGGNLILYLPLTRRVAREMGLENWEGFYPNMGEPGANVYHRQDFHPQKIRDILAKIGDAEVLADEIRGENDEYSFLQVYKKLSSATCQAWRPPLSSGKRALVVRYGAIGDFIQTTPVLKKLKQEGYHVTVNGSEVAREVLKYNPYVDEILVQMKDYVPNKGVTSGPLMEYWKELSTKYDKFVNLTGSAEESLLVPDGKLMVMMDQIGKEHPELDEQNQLYNAIRGIRKQVGDTNYYDNHLAKAGYEDRGLNGELFFSDQEEVMAQGFRDKYPGRFIVMWVLSGSSYHKRYPFFQQVAQELIIRNPDILLISVGDAECALIERSESNRYLPRAGRWLLRTSLVMTKYVDLVVGPETGILNAAGCFDTPKITMLSHSSHDNLCKYWKNDFCLAPDTKEVFCYPCHVLHFIHTLNEPCPSCSGLIHEHKDKEVRAIAHAGFWTCPYEVPAINKDATGLGPPSPICTTRLTPNKVLARIDEVYRLWKSGQRTVPQPIGIAVNA